mgnify:CR=1 FL=1
MELFALIFWSPPLRGLFHFRRVPERPKGDQAKGIGVALGPIR